MMISIFNGPQLFETRECVLVRLPDGREGAIWRGLAYPLELPDQHIEIGSEAFPPGDCVHRDASIRPPQTNFAVIEGVEEAYVLLSGPSLFCETAAGELKAYAAPHMQEWLFHLITMLASVERLDRAEICAGRQSRSGPVSIAPAISCQCLTAGIVLQIAVEETPLQFRISSSKLVNAT